MAKQPWFHKSENAKGFAFIAKPVRWQGWAVQFAMVFLFAMLMQGLARWGMTGFAPLAAGVWLLAGVFIVLWAYFALVNRFSRAD